MVRLQPYFSRLLRSPGLPPLTTSVGGVLGLLVDAGIVSGGTTSLAFFSLGRVLFGSEPDPGASFPNRGRGRAPPVLKIRRPRRLSCEPDTTYHGLVGLSDQLP